MGTALTGSSVASTYDALLKITDNGPVGGTAKVVTDGLGNDSCFKLGTTSAEFTGGLTGTTLNLSGALTGAAGSFTTLSASGAFTTTYGTITTNVGTALALRAASNTSVTLGVDGGNQLVVSGYSGTTIANGLSVTGSITASGLFGCGGSTPASAAASGTAGTITWDSSYIYVCTATNTWKRVAIATW